MDFRQLRYFLVVSDELHFHRAAERLHLAQPALTRQIRQLEAELDATLFSRTTRRVELTPAGEIFKGYALQCMRDFERTKLDLRRLQSEGKARLVVGYLPSVAYTLIPEILRRFRNVSTEIELDLKSMFAHEQFKALLHGDIDVGILKPWQTSPELVFHTLASEPLVVAVPLNHPLAGKTNIPLKRFEHDLFIMHGRPFSAGMTRTYEITMDLFREAGFEPRVAPEAPQDMYMALTMVGAGFGVSILPRSILMLGVANTAYAEIREPGAKSQIAVTHRRDHTNPAIAAFVAAAAETLDRIDVP